MEDLRQPVLILRRDTSPVFESPCHKWKQPRPLGPLQETVQAGVSLDRFSIAAKDASAGRGDARLNSTRLKFASGIFAELSLSLSHFPDQTGPLKTVPGWTFSDTIGGGCFALSTISSSLYTPRSIHDCSVSSSRRADL